MLTPNETLEEVQALIDKIKLLTDPATTKLDREHIASVIDFNNAMDDYFRIMYRENWDERTDEEIDADRRESYNEDFKYEK